MSAKRLARAEVERRRPEWSEWCRTIFEFGETAWREYRSADFYVELLRREGFEVEAGSGGMPTAFCAVWSNGDGPTIGGYAEYDGVPGNCQAADVAKRPRDGLSPQAGGHTDPHSALGIGALMGALAAKAAMQDAGVAGRIKFMGEPAEKVRGSKPIHAAKGYYDDLDAAISFHPFYMAPYCNTVRWDTHCAPAYAPLYSFDCDEPQDWLAERGDGAPIPAHHAAARAPGATDAVIQMHQLAKTLQQHVLAPGMSWSINEAILTIGQATADNLPATLGQILYMARVPDLATAERVLRGLDHVAEHAAALTQCRWRRDWVSKSRPGLANHAMARLTYANLASVGPPRWEGEAIRLAREIQRGLGQAPMERPFLEATERLIEPQEAERRIRAALPPGQTHFTSDDYTEYCWHAPTARLYVGRPTLKPPADGGYPYWVMNALGGLSPCIDPMIDCAAKTIAGTMLDLLTDPAHLAAAKVEYDERTGGGIGGSQWLAPLCDYEPPIHFRWPEYVETPRGRREWWIPATP